MPSAPLSIHAKFCPQSERGRTEKITSRWDGAAEDANGRAAIASFAGHGSSFLDEDRRDGVIAEVRWTSACRPLSPDGPRGHRRPWQSDVQVEEESPHRAQSVEDLDPVMTTAHLYVANATTVYILIAFQLEGRGSASALSSGSLSRSAG
jgi:hypothetical protein